MNESQNKAREMLDDMPGMKEKDIVELGPCVVCGKPQIDRDITFYVVEIKRAGFDRLAIERQAGLQMMLGSPAIASAMGPNEDLAKVFHSPGKVFVHESCAGKIGHVLELMRKREEPKENNDAE